MSTHSQFANPLTPSQPQSPCKLFIQPLFGGRFLIQIPTPGRQANLGLRLYNRPSAVAFVIGLRTTMRKTAEERFHTLARGWLAYPVTPTHAHLPPKSGCRGIQRGAFRRGATTPSRNPVRGAKRQRAGTQRISLSTACRRYATSP